MARLEKIGAFGLTEPQHGLDAVGLETSARRDGDARAQRPEEVDRQRVDRRLRDHLGPRGGRRGRRIRRREGHARLRGDRDDREDGAAGGVAGRDHADRRPVPAENKLAECHSFKDVSRVLDRTRYTVAWRALGLATASYEPGAGARPAPRAVRPADRRLPARAGQAGADARRDHRRCSLCWRLSKLAATPAG